MASRRCGLGAGLGNGGAVVCGTLPDGASARRLLAAAGAAVLLLDRFPLTGVRRVLSAVIQWTGARWTPQGAPGTASQQSAEATPSRTHAQTGLRMGRTRQWASVRNTQDDDASLFLSLELGPRPMKVLARKNLHAL